MDFPAAASDEPWPPRAAVELRARQGLAARRGDRPPLGPGRRRPAVSSYRVFMTIVFVCIVLVDIWSDRRLSAAVSLDIVGPVSVIVWAFTLLGSFGVGPIAAIWAALYRQGRAAT